jgi:hypothetical protein
MNRGPPIALVMRSDAGACRTTAAILRDLGFAVSACGDELHLYAQAIHLATAPAETRRRAVIVTEPTEDVVRDLEMLRSANWRMPLILVGHDASVEVGRRIDAACLPCEQPSAAALERAIEEARKVSAHS